MSVSVQIYLLELSRTQLNEAAARQRVGLSLAVVVFTTRLLLLLLDDEDDL